MINTRSLEKKQKKYDRYKVTSAYYVLSAELPGRKAFLRQSKLAVMNRAVSDSLVEYTVFGYL